LFEGVQGAFDGTGAKTVIPRKVIGKFSIRLVPNQDEKTVEKLVQDYLQKKFAERKSPNKLKSVETIRKHLKTCSVLFLIFKRVYVPWCKALGR
jgi:acetylornithine deacetylase/succinyl-diaminopimelate desuccinylase-like protein